MTYCPNCGKEVGSEAKYCSSCGSLLDGSSFNDSYSTASSEPYMTDFKSPGIAAVFSFLICGLGQIYDGRIGRGFGFMAFELLIACLVIVATARALPTISSLLLIFLFVFDIWNIYDAYDLAKKHNCVAASIGY